MPSSRISNRLASIARELKENVSTDWRTQGPYQWGTVAAIRPTLPFSTLDVYLDSSSTSPGATLALKIPYLNGYNPTVGDVVLIGRMAGAARTQRIILGPLETTIHGLNLAGVMLVASLVSAGAITIGSPGLLGMWTLYRARAVNTTAQSIPYNTFTKVALDSKTYDPNNNFDVVNNRYIVPVTGFYWFSGFVELGSTAVVNLHVTIFKNGTEWRRLFRGGSPNTGPNGASGSDIQLLMAGDYLELWCYHAASGGVAVPLDTDATSSYLAIEYRGVGIQIALQGTSVATSEGTKGTHF